MIGFCNKERTVLVRRSNLVGQELSSKTVEVSADGIVQTVVSPAFLVRRQSLLWLQNHTSIYAIVLLNSLYLLLNSYGRSQSI